MKYIEAIRSILRPSYPFINRPKWWKCRHHIVNGAKWLFRGLAPLVSYPFLIIIRLICMLLFPITALILVWAFRHDSNEYQQDPHQNHRGINDD